MTRSKAFYLPMLEVVDYLLDNEFIVYICSGQGEEMDTCQISGARFMESI